MGIILKRGRKIQPIVPAGSSRDQPIYLKKRTPGRARGSAGYAVRSSLEIVGRVPELVAVGEGKSVKLDELRIVRVNYPVSEITMSESCVCVVAAVLELGQDREAVVLAEDEVDHGAELDLDKIGSPAPVIHLGGVHTGEALVRLNNEADQVDAGRTLRHLVAQEVGHLQGEAVLILTLVMLESPVPRIFVGRFGVISIEEVPVGYHDHMGPVTGDNGRQVELESHPHLSFGEDAVESVVVGVLGETFIISHSSYLRATGGVSRVNCQAVQVETGEVPAGGYLLSQGEDQEGDGGKVCVDPGIDSNRGDVEDEIELHVVPFRERAVTLEYREFHLELVVGLELHDKGVADIVSSICNSGFPVVIFETIIVPVGETFVSQAVASVGGRVVGHVELGAVDVLVIHALCEQRGKRQHRQNDSTCSNYRCFFHAPPRKDFSNRFHENCTESS